MLSSNLLSTVLLVSAVVIRNTECRPVPGGSSSNSAPHDKSLAGVLGRSKSMSSTAKAAYHGPIRPETDKEAIAIIDAKHDDHMAVTHLRNTGLYRTVHTIISGVENKEAAHGSLFDHQSQIAKARWEKSHGPYQQSELKVFNGGENPLGHPLPHEVHFQGKNRPIKHSFQDLHNQIHQGTKQVDVFHLGPMKDKDIDTVFHQVKKTGAKVGLSHSTVGYNSLQSSEIISKQSKGMVEKAHLEGYHLKPHNKDAKTILMQTITTFGDSKGGTQSLDWTKLRSPPNAVKGVTEDEPFHFMQFEHADGEIAKHNKKHEKMDTHKQVDVPAPIPGKSEDEQKANIWAGRAKGTPHGKEMSTILINHVKERQKALKKIQEHDPEADHSNAIRRLNAVKDGLENPCAVEVCDANHVATSIDAYYHDRKKLVPVTVKTGRDVAPATKGEPTHGYTILYATPDHARKLLNLSFSPVFGDK